MTPAQAPLPTDSSLPFHPPTGSHTSIRISESAVGLSAAATRQNAGRLLNAALGFEPRPGVGNVKAPASTCLADRIVVCGSARDVIFSQGAAQAMAAPSTIEPSRKR